MATNAQHQAAWRQRQKAPLTEAQARIRELEQVLAATRARIQELEAMKLGSRGSGLLPVHHDARRPRNRPKGDPLAKFLYPTPVKCIKETAK